MGPKRQPPRKKQPRAGPSHALKDPPPSSGANGAAAAAAASPSLLAPGPPPPRKRRPKDRGDAKVSTTKMTAASTAMTAPSPAAGDDNGAATSLTKQNNKRQKRSGGILGAAAAAAASSDAQLSEFQNQLREMRVEMEIFPHGRAKGRRKRQQQQRRARQEQEQQHEKPGAAILEADDNDEGERGNKDKKKAAVSSSSSLWSARHVQMALDRRDHEDLRVNRDPHPRTRGARAAESHDFLTGRGLLEDDNDDDDDDDDDELEDADDQGGSVEDDEDVEVDDDDDADYGMEDDDLDDEEEYDNVILEADDSDAVDDEGDEDEDVDDGEADRAVRDPDAAGRADDERNSSVGGRSKARRMPRRFRRTAPRAAAAGGGAPRRGGSRSKLFRMRNFKSIRMADRHGDALASFAMGRHGEAIAKLQDVARELPSAPQVYASLAMVYEEMLSDLEKNSPPEAAAPTAASPTNHSRGDEAGSSPTTTGAASDRADLSADSIRMDPRDAWLAEQLVIAKKAYGSYHIAALLCKRDYSFWVRAGDIAATIAGLHTRFMTAPRPTPIDGHQGDSDWEKHLEHHRSEKQRWLTEAKNDYKAADNIKPPGIDIPAKLAAVCVELGSLSEALTILTDLRNRKAVGPWGRSDFEASHKACLLYSDLMLRIGYECRRWNSGDQTAGNVSLRRWLRAHARTFDWEERRVSALGMALEAAAGTECSRHVSEWLNRRAQRTEARVVSASNKDEAADAVDPFEGEKALLLEKSRKELEDFDRTTTDIDPDSNLVPGEKRRKARNELLSSHDAALRELEREFGRSEGQNEPADSILESANERDADRDSCTPLPVSASTRSVCAIASELMRQLILLKAYEGGRLVGEAVSMYFRKRAVLLEQSAQRQITFSERSSRLDTLLNAGTIEGIQEDFSDDESAGGLSDEEELARESTSVIESLRKGLLTPELNVLLAACLLGERSRDFVAFKCLQAIESLEQESAFYFLDAEVDTGVSYDSRWTVFKRLSTGPLHRTEAFALVGKTVLDCGRAPELSGRLLPLFEGQVQRLHEAQVVALIAKDVVVTFENLSVVFKVMTAAARFQLMSAESLIRQHMPAEANLQLKKSVRTLANALRVMWTMKPPGAVPAQCLEATETMAAAMKLRLSISSDAIRDEDMLDWIEVLGESVSILSSCPDVEEPSDVSLPATGRIPLPVEWLTEKRRAIALRSYNLSVSLNVARFSGWEDSEFRMELMRRRSNSSTYFGITMSDGMVSGILREHESDVLDQWDSLQELLETKTEVSLRGLMEVRRLSSWYRDAVESLEGSSRAAPVAVQAENSGLSILLSYSRACLLAARMSNDELRRRGCILNALPILLPVLQFMLKYIVWEADIGKVSETRATVMDWRNSIPFDESKADATQQFKRSRRRTLPEPKEETREWVPLHGAFAGERHSPIISNLVAVPCDTLLEAWNADTSLGSDTCASIHELSATVLQLLRKLRLCNTEEAAETASIQLAAATIDLIPHPHCQNPFKCLQMAPMFASQGSTLGASDSLFRAPLPAQRDCNPSDALAILGRAECMQALHFCTEAAFLCDFIVSLCHMHLQNGSSIGQSFKRWTVVRALAYNTSVAIRHTAGLSLNDADKKTDAMEWRWPKDAIDELLRGREDCLTFVGMVRPDSSVEHTVPRTLSAANSSEQNELSGSIGFQEEECFEKLSRPGFGSIIDEYCPALSDVVEV